MSSSTEDLVRRLFDALPEPESYHKVIRPGITGGLRPETFKSQLTLFVQESSSVRSFADPDGESIYEHAKEALDTSLMGLFSGCDNIFLLGLGVLAYQEGRPPPNSLDHSKKNRYMRYAAWILHGRRDNEYPFGPPLLTAPLPDQYAILPKHVTSLRWICAHCGQCDAKLRCEECFVEECGFLAVYYCDLTCQKAHREQHTMVCISRRDIGRAMSVLKSLSDLFWKTLYHTRVERFRANNDIITTKEYDLEGDKTDPDPSIFRGDFLLSPPPYDLIRRGADESTAVKDLFMAMVYHEQSVEVYGFEWPFIRLFLKPVCKLIEEITITPKNAALTMARTWGGMYDSSIFRNIAVLRAQGDSGEEFAIDLVGAEFGWKDSFSPWKHFVAHRVHSVDFTVQEGSHQDLVRNKLQSQGLFHAGPGVNVAAAITDMRVQLIDAAADHTIQSWLRSHGFEDVRKMYELPREKFLDNKSLLLQHVKEKLDMELEILRKQGSHRLYFLKNFQVRVATTPKVTERYQSVWLTEQEVEELSDKPEELRAAWIRKLRTANHLYRE